LAPSRQCGKSIDSYARAFGANITRKAITNRAERDAVATPFPDS
jgi:hypothetical protein